MTDANGAVVSSSSGGTVQLSSNGQITNLDLGTFNRPPTLVQFQGQGAQGRSDLPTLRLNITNPNGQSVNNSTIDVPGVWKPDLGDAGAYTYDWSPAAQWLPASQTANPSALEVTASLLDAAGVQGATLGTGQPQAQAQLPWACPVGTGQLARHRPCCARLQLRITGLEGFRFET